MRFKLSSNWTTDPLFIKQGPDYYFYQNDHLGTPQKLTAVNGAVVWAAKYSSFGKATIEVETVENNLRFPGQYSDSETGLHYNYFRYYDPSTGRYLKADPIGLEGGINVYEYASQNPLMKIDPFGLKVIDGMNCKEIDRVVVPSIASGQPFHQKSIGAKTICTDIVIEDTMSCVCIGKEKEAFTEYYDNYVSWAVVYSCCPLGNECEVEGCKIVTKYESMKLKPREEEVYRPIPGGGRITIKHGFTNSNAFSVNPKDRWCSECPNGIGKPM